MTQTLQNGLLGATRKAARYLGKLRCPRAHQKRRALLASALGAARARPAGVVHGQQRYSCIIFALFHRRNKARCTQRTTDDLM